MESLVSQVRSRPFSGDQQFWWKTVSGSAAVVPEPNPQWKPQPDGSLKEVPEPGGRAMMLFARRATDGKLTVVIMTDWGSHATNQAGFVYYDQPPVVETDSAGNSTLDVPGYLRAATSEQSIDAHWREVYNPDAD